MPSIDQIYAKEDLPALAPQLPGELKMLERFGLTEYAEKLRIAHCIPRNSEKANPA